MSGGTKGLLKHLGGMPVLNFDIPLIRDGGTVWFVDGTHGLDGNTGKSLSGAKKTIQDALDEVAEGDTVLVLPKEMTATSTDPVSYAETLIVNHPNVSIIGVSRGRTQGGLPQIKIGAGSTAMLSVRAPGCLIANLGFNGIDSTGGGILLDDDGGSTKSAFGTTITGCHFKNCVGSTATDAKTGGAIMWNTTGGAWQVLIKGNRFYKNVGDIVVKNCTSSVPQDVIIEDNIFSGPAASVDCNLYMRGLGGSGVDGLIIRNNVFSAWPTLGSGVNATMLSLSGCVGTITGNSFGCTGKTFKAAGDAIVPATMLITNNWAEDGLKGRDA